MLARLLLTVAQLLQSRVRTTRCLLIAQRITALNQDLEFNAITPL